MRDPERPGIGVDGETDETYETSEGNETATPLRLSISLTFLGELDSRLSEFYW